MNRTPVSGAAAAPPRHDPSPAWQTGLQRHCSEARAGLPDCRSYPVVNLAINTRALARIRRRAFALRLSARYKVCHPPPPLPRRPPAAVLWRCQRHSTNAGQQGCGCGCGSRTLSHIFHTAGGAFTPRCKCSAAASAAAALLPCCPAAALLCGPADGRAAGGVDEKQRLSLSLSSLFSLSLSLSLPSVPPSLPHLTFSTLLQAAVAVWDTAAYLAAGLVMYPAAPSEMHGCGGPRPFTGVDPATGRPVLWELLAVALSAVQARLRSPFSVPRPVPAAAALRRGGALFGCEGFVPPRAAAGGGGGGRPGYPMAARACGRTGGGRCGRRGAL